MKLAWVAPAGLCVALLSTMAGCASAQKPAAAPATLTSAEVEAQPTQTAAEAWAEKKAAVEAASIKKAGPREAADPLATNSELEESAIPKMEITPANQVRAKSPGELNAAVGVVKSATSVDGAALKLTQRLGKPNWTESPKGQDGAKRRIWVAPAGAQCQRLVLAADGSVEVETASKSEWRMLAASAHQNPCTGEIKRGLGR